MANQDLQVRFTDEKYATRQDVARSLGTNLIDPIWNQILEYRRRKSQSLNIVDFANAPYSYCFCQLIQDKVSEVNEKNFDYRNIFNNYSKESLGYQSIMNKLFANCLKSIAKATNKNIDDVSIENILRHQNVDPQFAYLERYLEAFDVFEREQITVDDNLLAEFYSIMLGQPELSEFYRSNDLQNARTNVFIGREYMGAPVSMIESQMEGLFNFINRRDIPLFVRVVIVCYVFNYVKPFQEYNLEMSVLLAKSMIVNEVGECGAYLPIERLLSEQQLLVASLSKEVQKTRDLTYVVNIYLDILTNTIDETSNVFVQHSLDQLHEDFKETQEEVEKEFFPVEEKKTPEVKPVPQPIKKEEPKVRVESFTNVTEQTYSEKELQKLTEELLETDPTLKRGQAHFYIRHREKNHYYTIEQYRKCEGCVYETARTSMDHLAIRGYYRREKVNNKKFVYTPIFKD